MFEPAHLLGHLVEGLLEHDSLSADEHHVHCNKHLARQRSIHPLVASICAAQEVAAVHDNAAPDLDGEVADCQDGLEEQVDVHLLAEHLLAQEVSALKVRPVVLRLAILVMMMLLRLTILVMVILQECLGGLSFGLNHGAFAEEVVLLVGDDHVENEVDKEEGRGPVHAGRVHLLRCAVRAEGRNKGEQERQCVKDVHHSEVPLCLVPQSFAWRATQGIQNLVESEEVEVVRRRDH